MKQFKYFIFYFFIILNISFNTCIVYAANISSSVTNSSSSTISDSLGISASSCILMDIDANKILYEKNAYDKMYPASTTKTMTAILTMEKCNLADIVKVSYYAVHDVPSGYSIANLQPNEEISVKDLLYSLMIGSANDSAFVLAQYIANNCSNSFPIDSSQSSKATFDSDISIFSNMMNNKAAELNCKNTHFVNPNGIANEDHYSTAYDLALIGNFARTFPLLDTIVVTLKFSLPSSNVYTGEARSMINTNILLHQGRSCYYKYANGFKTGYTDDAQYCIIATASKDDRNLLAVVLHAEHTNNIDQSRESDCIKLFEYGFNQYSFKNLISTGDVVTSVIVFNGTDDSKELNLLAKNDLKALLKNGEIIDLNPDIHVNTLIASIAKGSVVGSISYTIDGESYSTDLVAEHDVYASNHLFIIWIMLGIFAVLFLIVTMTEIKKSKKSKKGKRYVDKYINKYQ